MSIMASLLRIASALPILIVIPFILRALTFAEPAISTHMDQIRATTSHAINGQNLHLLDSFYGLPVFDDIFGNICAAFSLLQIFPEEHGAYWQSLVFLTEYAGIYAILLLEGSRNVNKGRFFGL